MAVTLTDLERIFPGNSEMAGRMRSYDWSGSELGPPENWPKALKLSTRIVLTSRHPMFVWWGKRLINLYNDGYAAFLCNKHPEAFGQPASTVWPEVWHQVGPRAQYAMQRDEGTYDEALPFVLYRKGYPEEAYVTFSYSPMLNDDGAFGGILCPVTEDTKRIQGERQMALLRELASRTADARSRSEACVLAAHALETNADDLPFALIYLLDMERGAGLLVGASGTALGSTIAQETVSLDSESLWNLKQVATTHRACVKSDLAGISNDLPRVRGQYPVAQAITLPLAASGADRIQGLLVLGLNPLRLLDDDYGQFLELVASGISTSIANADAYESERRRAESLAELDRAKTTFFSNISHEFRTPLTLLLGPIEDELRRNPDASSNLQIALRNASRLLKLVNTLLEFSRIEAARVRAVYRPSDLAALTRDLASNFRSVVEKAGLWLDVNCSPLREPVYVDREMWERIVLNLLSNAFKFTFAGSIAVGLRATKDSVELSISDTGTGIAEQELPKIFERFHRIEGAKGRTFEGTGIGLALVHELVKLHGGEVSVQSELGKGSTFTVTIPLGSAHLPKEQVDEGTALTSSAMHSHEFVQEAMQWLAEDASSAYLTESRPEESHVTSDGSPEKNEPGRRVLVADDNADMRQYVRRILSRRYAVTAVSNGEEALASALGDPPDLVLADVMMPKMDGFELLRKLRARPETASLPVILLSARAGLESRLEGLESGADDYLVKPFSAPELQVRVKTHLALAQLRKQAERNLRAALVEKDALLQEVHHRVKNNLQVIDSLLRLQADALPDARVREVVTDTANRVQAIAEIHELLSSSGDLGKVEIHKFIDRLCSNISSMFTGRARILVNVEPVNLDLQQAVPLGLILNELISNALKHAFPTGKSGTIRVQLQPDGESIVVRVGDNGIGFPEPLPKKSLGLDLVRVLTEQLHGVLKFESSGGAQVSVSFPCDHLSAAVAPPIATSRS